jgi:hypothetical protein
MNDESDDDSSHRAMTRRLSGALALAGNNQDGVSSDEDLMEEGANRATGNTEDGASSDDGGGLMGRKERSRQIDHRTAPHLLLLLLLLLLQLQTMQRLHLYLSMPRFPGCCAAA